ncbi:phage tail assembly chaperone G [Mammaliicoccus vitulinus]|uniref:phage tail assembly chaperone G n=1 Tax=Mammaliicoccus vitulinus TaxID=71237 RepID=UPI001869292B|nr:hypothetical protein [Mammaliicoccus vitulinus]
MKRNFIRLVKEVKSNDEVEFATYVTPVFISTDIVFEAADIVAEIESGKSKKTERELYEIMYELIVRIYNNQFTVEELRKGISAPMLQDTFTEQIQFIAAGAMDDERKKQLKEILK